MHANLVSIGFFLYIILNLCYHWFVGMRDEIFSAGYQQIFNS